MTIREIREILFQVYNQDQEIEIEDIYQIVGLYNRAKSIENKIKELREEKTSETFINDTWQKALYEANVDLWKYNK